MEGKKLLFDKVQVILLVLAILAFIGLLIDLIDGDRMKIASTFFLTLGLVAVLQWRTYKSRRWRTVGWISFVLSIAFLLFRLGQWAGLIAV